MRRKIVGVLFALVLMLSLGLVMVPLAKVGATTNSQQFTVSGNFVIPARVTHITVETWGGGGAGGGSTNAGAGNARGGAGGGGGAYAISNLTVVPGQTLQVIIGAGGTGVSGGNGNNGTPSFVGPDTNPNNALVRAAAGSGGTGNTGGGSPAGGAGGTVAASVGQMRVAGGNGQNGATGAGISSGVGGNGAYGGGSGGAARTSADGTADGNPGNVAGGGGGGARTQASGGARTGGAGAGGKVVITWVTYGLNISSTAGGSVTTPGEGSFTCGNGTIVDLVASPDANHRFVNWTGSVGTIANVSAAATNITMNGDYSITANFVRHWHLTISSTAGGSVTTPGIGSFTYDNGTVVDLVAVADEGHRFVGWAGDVSAIADVYAAETTIIMSGDYSITAEFEVGGPIQYQCNLVISSTAGGSVIEPGEGIFTIDSGAVVYLTAAPDIGYQFDRWTGDVDTVADIESMATTISMDDSYSISARFTAVGWYSIGGYVPVGGCFIATAAYGTPMAEEIQVLREFRDKYLLTNPVGSSLVYFYYRVSPPVAEFITDHPSLKPIVRAALLPAVAVSTLAINATVSDNAVMVSLLVLVSVVAAATLARRRESSV